MAPSSNADAYGLLRAAIEHPDPVVVLEPKKQYFTKEELDPESPVPPIGRAVVRRDGADATLVAYGPSVPVALAAVEQAAAEGRDLRVVDLRWIVPFDYETVMAAVSRTGRAVVVAEAPGFVSVSSEVAARIGERCFHLLEAPVRRVIGFDLPYPPPKLEHHHLPNVDRILEAPVRRVTGFDVPYPPPKLERHYLPGTDRILDAVDALQWDEGAAAPRASSRCPTSGKG